MSMSCCHPEPRWGRGLPAARYAWRGLPLIVAVLVAALASCDLFEDDSGSSKKKIKSQPYSTTESVTPGAVTTSAAGAVEISASIPVESVAVGIVAYGTDDEWKFIEHAGLWLGGDDNITGPDGPVPLSFNILNGGPAPSTLNNQAVAVHFPNNGFAATLKKGTYRIPVGAANSSSGALVVDTINSAVFYKTKTSQKPTLKLNVFVLNGTSGSITSQVAAEADPEIAGAINVLQNVYAGNAAIDVNVDVSIQYLDDTSLGNCLATSPGDISTEAEQFCLLRSYPQIPTNDAMNIFVISSLDYIDPANPGAGVIGLAAGIPGPFNMQGFATSGTMAEYQGDGVGTILGFTLAHEFGHFLGLFHTSQTNNSASGIIGEDPIEDTPVCKTSQVQQSLFECPDFGNLMFPFVDEESDPPITTGQGNVVKFNPGITVP